MTAFKRKYVVLHVHYYGKLGIVLLCLDPKEKAPSPRTFMPAGKSEEEKVMGKIMQSTVQVLEEFIPPGYQEPSLLKIEMSLDDYEKMGKPGILDEVALTLDTVKETDIKEVRRFDNTY